MNKRLYVYHKPNQMEGHKYTDDVAICLAGDKEEAVAMFSKIYEATAEDVEEVSFNHLDIAILTDY